MDAGTFATSTDERTGPETTPAQIRAAQRDPEAAAAIYAAWSEPVHPYCRRRLESPEVTEDATSRIFERVLGALPDYRVDETRPGATFRSWLFAITHNTIVDHHLRRRSHLSLDLLMHPLRDRPTFDPPDSGRALDEAAISRDEDRAVRIALGHLPERQRRVVELRLAGLKGPEIAETLNMTHPAVKSAQFRAYQTMREVLADLGYVLDVPEDDHATS